MFVNLLPQKLVIAMLIRRRLRQWAVIWASLLIIGLLLVSSNYRSLKQTQVQLDSTAQLVRPIRRLQTQITGINQRLKQLDKEIEMLDVICVPDRSLGVLAVLGNATKSPHYKVQIERLGLTSTGNRIATKTQSSAGAALTLSTVSLQGVADGDAGLASFVEALRESNVFSHVDLRSSLQYQRNNLTGRQFQVECKFAE